MRILYYSHLFSPYIGGMETFAQHLLSGLRRRGHEVRVVSSHDWLATPDFEEIDGVPVFRLPLRAAIESRDPETLLTATRAFSSLVREFSPDLCHLNQPSLSIVFAHLALRGLRLPILLSLHTQFRDELMRADPNTPLLHVIQRSDWITACADFVREELLARVPDVAERTSVIHYGCQFEDSEVATLPTRPTILWIGRMTPQKRLDLALEAFARIAVAVPDAHLIVGGDGPDRATAQERVEALGLQSRVEFRGWLNPRQVSAAMNEASVVLMSSEWEGLPLVAIEAGHKGRPLVVTKVGGLPEVVDHDVTGRIVEFGDCEALARETVNLLTNPDVASRLGGAGRRRATDHFGVSRMVDRFETLYQHLISRRN